MEKVNHLKFKVNDKYSVKSITDRLEELGYRRGWQTCSVQDAKYVLLSDGYYSIIPHWSFDHGEGCLETLFCTEDYKYLQSSGVQPCSKDKPNSLFDFNIGDVGTVKTWQQIEEECETLEITTLCGRDGKSSIKKRALFGYSLEVEGDWDIFGKPYIVEGLCVDYLHIRVGYESFKVPKKALIPLSSDASLEEKLEHAFKHTMLKFLDLGGEVGLKNELFTTIEDGHDVYRVSIVKTSENDK